jgi:hypothetical protein
MTCAPISVTSLARSGPLASSLWPRKPLSLMVMTAAWIDFFFFFFSHIFSQTKVKWWSLSNRRQLQQ